MFLIKNLKTIMGYSSERPFEFFTSTFPIGLKISTRNRPRSTPRIETFENCGRQWQACFDSEEKVKRGDN